LSRQGVHVKHDAPPYEQSTKLELRGSLLRPAARQAGTTFQLVDVDHAIAENALEVAQISLGEAAEVQLPEGDAGLLYHVLGGSRVMAGDVGGGPHDVGLELPQHSLGDGRRSAIFDENGP